NLFASGEGNVQLAGGDLSVRQETLYPWDGEVRITLGPAHPAEFTVYVRIPGWAVDHPVPGTLYRTLEPAAQPVTLSVNGKRARLDTALGYAAIRRTWKKGDVVTLHLPMSVQRIVANDSLEDDRGKVALQRGPLVYCLEGADAPDGHVTDIVIPDTAVITDEFRSDLLNGLTVLHGRACTAERTLSGEIAAGPGRPFSAIPYYAWAHRGKCEMTVWPARTTGSALPLPAPTLARKSRLSSSRDVPTYALNDQLMPKNSSDESVPYLHWWPKKGTTEWVEYDFPGVETVSSAGVYWFDDTGEGECRVPKSWRILYREGSLWKPVSTPLPLPVTKDTLSTVSFTPVRTDALRLEVDLQSGFSAGIFEWKVE
ncbi:MAG TPA: glycoside hydrolase family 127 protein, partial [Bacteroidota bacterium]|nr:glycoside hydrolase family 127 protein [Bacteroidota bacterium]